mmetsp:Transcript_4146/g.10023  ORF Transcript_4146/g.10023 Transcript_4146/m.10023 type:complete len:137 (+) Transcript_4146:956-1366(+)
MGGQGDLSDMVRPEPSGSITLQEDQDSDVDDVECHKPEMRDQKEGVPIDGVNVQISISGAKVHKPIRNIHGDYNLRSLLSFALGQGYWRCYLFVSTANWMWADTRYGSRYGMLLVDLDLGSVGKKYYGTPKLARKK